MRYKMEKNSKENFEIIISYKKNLGRIKPTLQRNVTTGIRTTYLKVHEKFFEQANVLVTRCYDGSEITVNHAQVTAMLTHVDILQRLVTTSRYRVVF